MTNHGQGHPGESISTEAAFRALDDEERRLRDLIGDLEDGGVVQRSGTDEHLAAVEDTSFDGGTELAERSLELGILDSLEAQLAEVQAARERVNAGTYGICERCGAAIGAERLRALPAARECTSHSP
jgi:DnaK suppressor protein